MNDIQFIYFDVGGVILEFEQAYEEIRRKTNKSYKEIGEVFDTYSALGKASAEEMLKDYKSELHLDFETYEDFVTSYTQAFIPIPETHKLIKELAGKYPIGLLSNTEPQVLETSIKLGKIPDITYAALIASCYEGYRKPDKEIYLIAQERSKKSADSILLIDDLQENIDSAKELGWKTVLFDTKDAGASVDTIRKLTT